MTTHILALEKDLFFAVKIRDTLRHHDIEAKTARNLAIFEQALTMTGEEKPALGYCQINSVYPGRMLRKRS